MITFEDGSSMEAQDWTRIMSVLKQRAKEGKAAPKAIEQGGVTVNVEGLTVKKDAKIKGGNEYSNYIESVYKKWKIRVWKISKDNVYGVNYFKDEDIRYLEVPYGDVKDERGVFKYVETYINDIED